MLTSTTGSNTTSYAWDFENRLTSGTLPGTAGTVTFKYDPFGRRIYKSSTSGTSIYAYDDDGNLIEVRKSRMTRKSTSLVFLATCFLYLLGCELEKPTTVRVASGPSFAFSGSGRLASLTVSAPLDGQRIAFPCGKVLFPCSGLASIVWQIHASSGTSKAASVDGLDVTVGKLPEGYTQAVPSQSSDVPSFKSGVIYAYTAETLNAAGQSGYFYVERSGAVVAVDVPELCVTLKEGREVRVNCTTKQPFQEPTDLESFVSAHRKN
jgi:YD repeat-containing protein